MTHKQVMLRAAELFEEDADAIKQSHTRLDGTWDLGDPIDESAKDDYDERVELAAKLKLIACGK